MGEREKQYSGKISYKKLFELMEQQNIKKRDLREKYKISPTIVNRLNNNSNVAVDTIMYLCEILNCIINYILILVHFHILSTILFVYFCVLLLLTYKYIIVYNNINKSNNTKAKAP